MTRFSCIIPAYNMEHYLERCIMSLTTQLFEDIEILVIDDGSLDSTFALAQKIASKDTRIRVFQQKNAGQGSARNYGLREAKGEYIWFVDADDWVQGGSFLHYDQIVAIHAPEMMFANFASYRDDETYVVHAVLGDMVGESICPRRLQPDVFQDLFGWKTPPYRLIVRRDILEKYNICFPEKLFYEDHPFSLRLLGVLERVFIDPLPTYSYYQRSDSTVRRQDRRIFDFLPIRQQCLQIFREFDWDKQFPALYTTYLLPSDFYDHHVPVMFQKEFLQQLRESLSAADLDQIKNIPKKVSRARALLFAINKQSPLAYRYVCALQAQCLLQRSLRQVYDAIRWSKRFAKRMLRQLNNILQGKPGLMASYLYHCHPSVDMEACSIDVRVTQRNAPYIFADEGASLNGRFIFERGVGKMCFGQRCSIGGNTTIICSQAEGVHVGAQVMVSWGCTLIDSNAHALDAAYRENDEWYWRIGAAAGYPGLFKDWAGIKSAAIRIDDYAWIGFNSIILGGVNIGRGAIVGAGSVVSKHIPPYTIFAGNPACFIKLAPRREGWSVHDMEKARQMGASDDVLKAMQEALEKQRVVSEESELATQEESHE